MIIKLLCRFFFAHYSHFLKITYKAKINAFPGLFFMNNPYALIKYYCSGEC